MLCEPLRNATIITGDKGIRATSAITTNAEPPLYVLSQASCGSWTGTGVNGISLHLYKRKPYCFTRQITIPENGDWHVHSRRCIAWDAKAIRAAAVQRTPAVLTKGNRSAACTRTYIGIYLCVLSRRMVRQLNPASTDSVLIFFCYSRNAFLCASRVTQWYFSNDE